MGGSEQLLYFDPKVVSRSWETLVCPMSLMGEQETKVILILPAPARKHWEKGEVAWQQSRSQEEGIFFLQIQPIFSPSSLLKSREELFFLVVSCSAVKSRGSAASQKEEEVLLSSISPPQDPLAHLGGFFSWTYIFFLLSALTQQS